MAQLACVRGTTSGDTKYIFLASIWPRLWPPITHKPTQVGTYSTNLKPNKNHVNNQCHLRIIDCLNSHMNITGINFINVQGVWKLSSQIPCNLFICLNKHKTKYSLPVYLFPGIYFLSFSAVCMVVFLGKKYNSISFEYLFEWKFAQDLILLTLTSQKYVLDFLVLVQSGWHLTTFLTDF